MEHTFCAASARALLHVSSILEELDNVTIIIGHARLTKYCLDVVAATRVLMNTIEYFLT